MSDTYHRFSKLDVAFCLWIKESGGVGGWRAKEDKNESGFELQAGIEKPIKAV